MRAPVKTLVALLAAALVPGACDSGTSPAGSPAAIVIVAGNGQQATVGTLLPEPVAVRVLDASDRPVPNAIVSFVVTSGGGSVALGSVQTDGDGLARDFWTLGTSTSVAHAIETRIGSAGALLVASFDATPLPDAPHAVVVASGNAQSAVVQLPLPSPIAVRVDDQHGNPIPGVPVAFAVQSGGGTLSAESAITNTVGVASVSWTLGTTGGAQSVSATIASGASASFTATGLAGPARRLVVVSQPTAGRIAQVLGSFIIQVTDAHGNPWNLPNLSIGVSVSAGGLTGTGVQVTDLFGRATFSGLTPTGAAGARVFGFTPTADSLAPAQSATVSVTHGEPHNFFIVSGDNQSATAGSYLVPPVVRVTDAGGNAVPDIAVAWSNITGNASVTGANTTTNSRGESSPAVWQVSSPAGPARIRATMTYPGKTLTLDIHATVLPGPPASIVSNATHAGVVGHPLAVAPSVTVRDADGNTVAAGHTIMFSVSSGGAASPERVH